VKYLVSSVLLVLFLTTQASAGYFVFTQPGFEEKVLKEEVQNGETILTTINSVAIDQFGTLYCLKSDRGRLIDEETSYTWEELETIQYSVKITTINQYGEESVFAEGTLPLKTTIAGILLDTRTKRLLVFLKSLELTQGCPFVSSGVTFSKKTLQEGTKAWDWSGLESCIYEKVSILQVTGFGLPVPVQ
jgi:hypothetical protein